MDFFTEKRGIIIPHLGLAAASFASFLTILTMSKPPELAFIAVNYFSIGIPLTVACLFLPRIEDRPSLWKDTIFYINSVCVTSGTIACLIGLYNCFLMISKKAANNFKWMAIIIIILSIVSLLNEIRWSHLIRKKKSEENNNK